MEQRKGLKIFSNLYYEFDKNFSKVRVLRKTTFVERAGSRRSLTAKRQYHPVCPRTFPLLPEIKERGRNCPD